MKAADNSHVSNSSNHTTSTPSPRLVFPDEEAGVGRFASPQGYARLQPHQQHYQQQQLYQRQLEQQQQHHRYHAQQPPQQQYQQRLAYQQQLFAQQQFVYQQQQHFGYQTGERQLAYTQLHRSPHRQHSPHSTQQQLQQQYYVQHQQGEQPQPQAYHQQQHQQHACPLYDGLHARRSHHHHQHRQNNSKQEQQQQQKQQQHPRPSSFPGSRVSHQKHHRQYHRQQHRRRQQQQLPPYSLLQQQHDEDLLLMHTLCPGGASTTDGLDTREGVAAHYHYYEEPELRSRKDICSAVAAVLGIGRVTGVFLCVFAATVTAAIIFDTAGPTAHDYYLSCHGNNVALSHNLFLIFLVLQLFFIVVRWGSLNGASSSAVSVVMTAVPTSPPSSRRLHPHHHIYHPTGDSDSRQLQQQQQQRQQHRQQEELLNNEMDDEDDEKGEVEYQQHQRQTLSLLPDERDSQEQHKQGFFVQAQYRVCAHCSSLRLSPQTRDFANESCSHYYYSQGFRSGDKISSFDCHSIPCSHLCCLTYGSNVLTCSSAGKDEKEEELTVEKAEMKAEKSPPEKRGVTEKREVEDKEQLEEGGGGTIVDADSVAAAAGGGRECGGRNSEASTTLLSTPPSRCRRRFSQRRSSLSLPSSSNRNSASTFLQRSAQKASTNAICSASALPSFSEPASLTVLLLLPPAAAEGPPASVLAEKNTAAEATLAEATVAKATGPAVALPPQPEAPAASATTLELAKEADVTPAPTAIRSPQAAAAAPAPALRVLPSAPTVLSAAPAPAAALARQAAGAEASSQPEQQAAQPPSERTPVAVAAPAALASTRTAGASASSAPAAIASAPAATPAASVPEAIATVSAPVALAAVSAIAPIASAPAATPAISMPAAIAAVSAAVSASVAIAPAPVADAANTPSFAIAGNPVGTDASRMTVLPEAKWPLCTKEKFAFFEERSRYDSKCSQEEEQQHQPLHQFITVGVCGSVPVDSMLQMGEAVAARKEEAAAAAAAPCMPSPSSDGGGDTEMQQQHQQQPNKQHQQQNGLPMSSDRTSTTTSPSSFFSARTEDKAQATAAASLTPTDDRKQDDETADSSSLLRVVVTPPSTGEPAAADYVAAPTPPSLGLTTRGRATESYRWRPYGIDWNSVWTAMTYFIYALGFYAAVLGWRVYGGSAANYTTWTTCSHLDFPTFGADLPLMHSVVADFTFIEVFGACAAHLLIVRKHLDPYRLSSYCSIFPVLLRGAYRPLLLKIVFVTQFLLQAALYVVLVSNLVICWTTGYGTPMQILSAVMLANVTLWVFCVLSHVLQADRMNPPLRPTLVYHWLCNGRSRVATLASTNLYCNRWIICLSIIWLCGFLFYFSVYGTYSTPFLVLHGVSWLIFLLLTYCKLPAVFPNWTSGNEDDYERPRPSLAVGNHLLPPPEVAHTAAELIPLSTHVQMADATSKTRL